MNLQLTDGNFLLNFPTHSSASSAKAAISAMLLLSTQNFPAPPSTKSSGFMSFISFFSWYKNKKTSQMLQYASFMKTLKLKIMAFFMTFSPSIAHAIALSLFPASPSLIRVTASVAQVSNKITVGCYMFLSNARLFSGLLLSSISILLCVFSMCKHFFTLERSWASVAPPLSLPPALTMKLALQMLASEFPTFSANALMMLIE